MKAFNRDRGTLLARHVAKADSFWTRFRGLKGRTELPPGEGLWIIPCRGVHTRGMAFPIDVLFLDQALKVVDKQEEMSPGRFGAIRWKARTVLELPAGTLTESGTEIGDRIELMEQEEA